LRGIRVRLDVDIGDVRIELDPIPKNCSIGNGFQYKYVQLDVSTILIPSNN
jgi:hypothetical protein